MPDNHCQRRWKWGSCLYHSGRAPASPTDLRWLPQFSLCDNWSGLVLPQVSFVMSGARPVFWGEHQPSFKGPHTYLSSRLLFLCVVRFTEHLLYRHYRFWNIKTGSSLLSKKMNLIQSVAFRWWRVESSPWLRRSILSMTLFRIAAVHGDNTNQVNF